MYSSPASDLYQRVLPSPGHEMCLFSALIGRNPVHQCTTCSTSRRGSSMVISKISSTSMVVLLQKIVLLNQLAKGNNNNLESRVCSSFLSTDWVIHELHFLEPKEKPSKTKEKQTPDRAWSTITRAYEIFTKGIILQPKGFLQVDECGIPCGDTKEGVGFQFLVATVVLRVFSWDPEVIICKPPCFAHGKLS